MASPPRSSGSSAPPGAAWPRTAGYPRRTQRPQAKQALRASRETDPGAVDSSLGEPRWRVRAYPVEDCRQVVGRPLLGDLPVLEPVDVDCVPAHLVTCRRDTEQLSLVRRLDHESQCHGVTIGDDILLLRVKVRQSADESPQ